MRVQQSWINKLEIFAETFQSLIEYRQSPRTSQLLNRLQFLQKSAEHSSEN